MLGKEMNRAIETSQSLSNESSVQLVHNLEGVNDCIVHVCMGVDLPLNARNVVGCLDRIIANCGLIVEKIHFSILCTIVKKDNKGLGKMKNRQFGSQPLRERKSSACWRTVSPIWLT